MSTELALKMPLTDAQSGIWFAQQLDPYNPSYNTAEYVEIKGTIDTASFARAVSQVIQKTETLHSRFGGEIEKPWQVLDPVVSYSLPLMDVSEQPDPYLACEERMNAELSRPVDLYSDRVFAMILFKLANDHYIWFIKIHHIAIDGFGFYLFTQRAAEHYTYDQTGASIPVATKARFDELIKENQEYKASKTFERDRQFWLDRFADDPDIVSFSNRTEMVSSSALKTSGQLSAHDVETLNKTFQSWHQGIFAAISIYLHRLTGAKDVVLGMPIMGRLGSVALTIPSTVMNIVPLRLTLSPNMTIQDLNRQISQEMKQVKKHGNYRHEHMRRDLNRVGNERRIFGPLVNIVPVDEPLYFNRIKSKRHPLAAGPVDDLTINVYDLTGNEGLRFDFEGNPAIYTNKELHTHHKRLLTFIQTITQVSPQTPIASLGLLDEEEKSRLLNEYNPMLTELDDVFLTKKIGRLAATNPEAIALKCEDRALTYKTLNEESNRWARYFLSKGIGPGDYVAIALPRVSSVVIAMLATLKAGAAYIPLDIDYPAERLRYMIKDADPVCIVTTVTFVTLLPEQDANPIIMLVDHVNDQPWNDCSSQHLTPTEFSVAPGEEDPAYVIYTSGSTGSPKGVVIPRKGLHNFIEDMRERFLLNERDEWLAVTTIAFDISALELYLPLTSGASVLFASKESVQEPGKLSSLMTRQEVTFMQATPTLWQVLMNHAPASLAGLHVLTGGEALPKHLKDQLLAHACEVTNLYGPTETTIWSTAKLIDIEDATTPSIGKPITNTSVYVLDNGLTLVPEGTIGELYIAGEGLASGYHGRPALTAERFIADPFGKPGSRMYRTGDLARWLEDGSLDYLGRVDHQIKLRGFRLELGEIEEVYAGHFMVEHIVVTIREDTSGDPWLVAYIIPATGDPIDSEQVREYGRKYLPDYMIPSAFVTLEKFPVTPNGKVDRKALPVPSISHGREKKLPRTSQEEVLAALFKEVLPGVDVGIDEDFFYLGGHSLRAVRLANRIKDVFGDEIGIGKIFDFPSVERLAQQLNGSKESFQPALIKQERPERVPLSFEQRRLWFLYQMEGPQPTYNIPLVTWIRGELDLEALEQALFDVVRRHETLRTIFLEKDGEAEQLILPIEQAIPVLSITECQGEDIQAYLNEAVQTSFKLEQSPMLKAQVFKRGAGDHVFMLLLHHTIADGWSLAPLNHDLSLAYTARKKKTTLTWPELPLQYADYAIWQKQWIREVDNPESHSGKQLNYWKKALHGLPEQLDLPFDGQRQFSGNVLGDTVEFACSDVTHKQLLDLSKSEGCSLFMVLQSGLAALLSRLGAGADIPIGSPIAGRNDDQLTDLIGYFVNTLVLRTNTEGDPPFHELLQRVKRFNVKAYKHQDLPFEVLVEHLNPQRIQGKNPLFQVMLAFQNTPEHSLDLPEATAVSEIRTVGAAKFDLTFEIEEKRDNKGQPLGLNGMIEYRTDLFAKETIEQMAFRFIQLLKNAVVDPATAISQLNVLTPNEKHFLSQKEDTGEHRTFLPPQIFEEQAMSNPEAVAVVCGEENVSYRSLNDQVNQIARLFISYGIGPGHFIAIALPRSINMIVAILATQKAGAAYIPLDPSHPRARLDYMIADAHPTCIVMNSEVRLSAPNALLFTLDDRDTTAKVHMFDKGNIEQWERTRALSIEDAAYVIYTSGSTGKPKGVVIPHQNVSRLFSATEGWFSFTATDVWTLFHSYAFDFSVWEMWGAFLNGGKLIIIPHEVSRNPEAFLEVLVNEKVTVLNQTPSAFYQLMQAETDWEYLQEQLSLRYIIFGGEALDFSRLQSWYDHFPSDKPQLVNMYGITETTVHVTYQPLSRAMVHSSGSSIVGKEIPDLNVYVLDEQLQPVPAGVTGEMYVAGKGLAQGYLGKPALTAERFIANPFGEPGSRLYRTGDMARWNLDGTLDYLGRADHQVKIRGFRIELGEIDHVILQHKMVKEVATVVREDRPGDQRIVAYVVSAGEENVDTWELQKQTGSMLPNYMRPSAYVSIPNLPLTPNGKLDQQALPAPDMKKQTAHAITAPQTPHQEMLVELFSEILGVTRIGIHDGFFDLGGHSLLAVTLMSRIQETFGEKMSIGTLFESPTVEGLAEKIESGEQHAALDVLLPLRKSGEEQPLFCVHPAGGLSWCYAGLMSALDQKYPLYGLQARAISEPEKRPNSLDEMAADYIRQLKTVQSEGPYRLLGWSLGGNIAQAMAVHLQAEGAEVSSLIMLDAYPDQFFYDPEEESNVVMGLLALGGFDIENLEGKEISLQNAIEWLRQEGSALASLDDETIQNLKNNYVNAVKLLNGYHPQTFDGNVLFFRSTIIPEWFEGIEPERWSPYINGTIYQYEIECAHKDMCQPGPIAEIGTYITNYLKGGSLS
ncbi:amino acid adenylation domain-containing protein [Salicibibacter cibi]|uniref:Amino acid adenylation domain-containing protein n=1 Tax=Salicibibacter cibi TaxID=2743001 RepID=A0A7T7CGV3_9BACI|nr:non-ribosomal peptide synthetase [Salicibibacter cibi]QQK81514.1 amino acid adenylation domain-containing protein [Salicibibacter cibi]